MSLFISSLFSVYFGKILSYVYLLSFEDAMYIYIPSMWFYQTYFLYHYIWKVCQTHTSIGYGPINRNPLHYTDVIMDTIASQITSLTIVYSTVYSDADQRKYQSSASLAFVQGIHRRPVNSPHKWPVTRKMFPFDDVIMIFLVLCSTYVENDELAAVLTKCDYSVCPMLPKQTINVVFNGMSPDVTPTCVYPTLGNAGMVQAHGSVSLSEFRSYPTPAKRCAHTGGSI